MPAKLVRSVLLGALLASAADAAPEIGSSEVAGSVERMADQDVADAWMHLFARLLVLRQQQSDFREGFKWNELVPRKPGAVDWPNPNLDVAYWESWIATDETSCTIVTGPKIAGRYDTVQFLDGWDETLANINERVFPRRPDGGFAICLRGASVLLPTDVKRIDLPVRSSRVMLRVELGSDWDEAVRLQHQFKLRTRHDAFPRPAQSPEQFPAQSRDEPALQPGRFADAPTSRPRSPPTRRTGTGCRRPGARSTA